MRNLTVNDGTQIEIARHLQITEQMLGDVASFVSGIRQEAEIIMLPDLGMPRNLCRICGGFFTGAFYRWTTNVPFVPIDATVNIDTISLFKVSIDVSNLSEFRLLIGAAREKVEAGIYGWNFDIANHFIALGRIVGSAHIDDGVYLVMHGSAGEFKHREYGLYPFKGVWYSDNVKVYESPAAGRRLRYIDGRDADRFFRTAKNLEEWNALRHLYIASVMFGGSNILDILSTHHYGMPDAGSVAIGCQWLKPGSRYVLATAPNRPLFIVEAHDGKDNCVSVEGKKYVLQPHGLGKMFRRQLHIAYNTEFVSINGDNYGQVGSLDDGDDIVIRENLSVLGRDNIPLQIENMLSICPGRVLAIFHPIYSYGRYGFCSV